MMSSAVVGGVSALGEMPFGISLSHQSDIAYTLYNILNNPLVYLFRPTMLSLCWIALFPQKKTKQI